MIIFNNLLVDCLLILLGEKEIGKIKNFRIQAFNRLHQLVTQNKYNVDFRQFNCLVCFIHFFFSCLHGLVALLKLKNLE